jgi:hypothetical protein
VKPRQLKQLADLSKNAADGLANIDALAQFITSKGISQEQVVRFFDNVELANNLLEEFIALTAMPPNCVRHWSFGFAVPQRATCHICRLSGSDAGEFPSCDENPLVTRARLPIIADNAAFATQRTQNDQNGDEQRKEPGSRHGMNLKSLFCSGRSVTWF